MLSTRYHSANSNRIDRNASCDLSEPARVLGNATHGKQERYLPFFGKGSHSTAYRNAALTSLRREMRRGLRCARTAAATVKPRPCAAPG